MSTETKKLTASVIAPLALRPLPGPAFFMAGKCFRSPTRLLACC
jgi:hypothetical protein